MKPFIAYLSFILIFGNLNSGMAQTTLRVAIGQIFCLDGDREGNFHRIEQATREAADQHADLICFPEMALLGWVNPDAHQRSYSIPGKDSERLAALAKKYQIFICVGLGEKVRDKLYDAAILISDEGKILAKHRKNNILSELMDPPYAPGEGVTAVETRFGKIGLLICADSFLDENLVAMRDEQPVIVLIPYGWAAEEDAWPEHGKELHKTIQNAAARIGCPVVGTDLIGAISHGPWFGQVYGGQSAVIDQDGNKLASAADRDREILIVDIPLRARK